MAYVYLLPQAVDRAAARAPESVAVRCRGIGLKYSDLAVASNRLANALRERGVRRGDRIGISMRKRIECAVAVYGIMKAGAAYVPLDPSLPPLRAAQIVRDCGIRCLVAEEFLREPISRLAFEGVELDAVIGLEDGALPFPSLSWKDVGDHAGESWPRGVLTELDLAYVLYTSGSTGVPKGIMHTHRSGLAFAEAACEAYGFTSSDRISNHAPLHFDLSTLDYFATALAGAATVVIPEEYTKLPASLSRLMEDERLTVLYCVPLALIHLLLHGALESRDLRDLRWVLFGGEPIPVKHLRGLMSRLPGARFSNVYGPTETNGCTFYVVPPLAEGDEAPIPIGDVFPNAKALVVGDGDQPVEDGEPGELLIRSPTRMLGYWGQPELTERATYRRRALGWCEELFHRTGDIVVRQDCGNLRFLGRRDRQVKVRGYRVELDEVEAHLVAHPAVEEAAAFAVSGADGERSIEAAVILRNGAAGGVAELGEHLRGRMPPYALPARIEIRDAFPRTSTGKIDRMKLESE